MQFFLPLIRHNFLKPPFTVLGLQILLFHHAGYSESTLYLKVKVLLLWEVFLYYLFQNFLALLPSFLLFSLYKTPVIWILDQYSNFVIFFSLLFSLFFFYCLGNFLIVILWPFLLNSLQPPYFLIIKNSFLFSDNYCFIRFCFYFVCNNFLHQSLCF